MRVDISKDARTQWTSTPAEESVKRDVEELEEKQARPKVKKATKGITGGKAGGYDKLLLVHLVLKVSHRRPNVPRVRWARVCPAVQYRMADEKSANPDWTALGQSVGKSPIRESLPE